MHRFIPKTKSLFCKYLHTIGISVIFHNANRLFGFSIENFSTQLPPDRINDLIQLAFNTWSPFCNKTFARINTLPADIQISFKIGYHGDGLFDTGILAHATRHFVHFNANIRFADVKNGQFGGTDLFTIALHEIGHSLGLAHNEIDRNSIMFPSIAANVVKGLNFGDKKAICELYCKKIRYICGKMSILLNF